MTPELQTRLIMWWVAAGSVVTYAIVCYIIFGFTRSISKTAYLWDGAWRWTYTVAMWLIALPLAYAGGTDIMYLSGGAVAITGLAWDSRRSKFTSGLHVAGAYGGIVGTLFSIGRDYGMWGWAIAGVVGIAALIIPQVKNHTYWVEYWTIVIALICVRIYLETLI